jgi:hypothetical protein
VVCVGSVAAAESVVCIKEDDCFSNSLFRTVHLLKMNLAYKSRRTVKFHICEPELQRRHEEGDRIV